MWTNATGLTRNTEMLGSCIWGFLNLPLYYAFYIDGEMLNFIISIIVKFYLNIVDFTNTMTVYYCTNIRREQVSRRGNDPVGTDVLPALKNNKSELHYKMLARRDVLS